MSSRTILHRRMANPLLITKSAITTVCGNVATVLSIFSYIPAAAAAAIHFRLQCTWIPQMSVCKFYDTINCISIVSNRISVKIFEFWYLIAHQFSKCKTLTRSLILNTPHQRVIHFASNRYAFKIIDFDALNDLKSNTRNLKFCRRNYQGKRIIIFKHLKLSMYSMRSINWKIFIEQHCRRHHHHHQIDFLGILFVYFIYFYSFNEMHQIKHFDLSPEYLGNFKHANSCCTY